MKGWIKLGILVVAVLAASIVLGHLYPQQIDNFGDRYFGPILYGRVPV